MRLLQYELIDEQFKIFTPERTDQERHESNIEILWDYY
jgi:hypothetical protein